MHQQSGRGSASEAIAAINVTPFVDVSLVLLIIFMVVMPTLTERVRLPVTNDPLRLPATASTMDVVVNADGTVVLGSVVVRREMLTSELERIHARHPDTKIAVRGDRNVAYGAVTGVMRDCREAGFEEVGLIASARH